MCALSSSPLLRTVVILWVTSSSSASARVFFSSRLLACVRSSQSASRSTAVRALSCSRVRDCCSWKCLIRASMASIS
uniref:Putative secreted protein n=1 Tax=Ixodes ricinus TaxID=34613 RepID=A0A6B0U009_IXORI